MTTTRTRDRTTWAFVPSARRSSPTIAAVARLCGVPVARGIAEGFFDNHGSLRVREVRARMLGDIDAVVVTIGGAGDATCGQMDGAMDNLCPHHALSTRRLDSPRRVPRHRNRRRRFPPLMRAQLAVIAIGRLLLFRDKKRALSNAKRVKDSFERLWDRGVIVALPLAAWGAPKLGRTNWNPRLLECTVPGNLADATGLSLPFGRWPNGLPRAIQLLGPPGSELSLIEFAERFSYVR